MLACGHVFCQVVPGTTMNVSIRSGNESEPAIAIDPSNPQRVFVTSNLIANATGLQASRSTNGGASWIRGTIANGSDGLSGACCDSSLSFDSFGNLWLAYLGQDLNIKLVLSTDGGQSWTSVGDLGRGDEPTVAAAAGSVWLTFHNGHGTITAVGASVTGLGAVGAFQPPEVAPGSTDGQYGDIAIGPLGQVLVAYQIPSGGEGPGDLYVNLDPDGLGPSKLGTRIHVTTSNVGGVDFIPGQPGRSVDAEAGLSWDRSGGLYNNRVYLAYTDEAVNESDNTEVFLRYSDNNGATWSNPVRVNDDSGAKGQFLHRIAIDETSGDIALSWLDCRNDTGSGPDDTDGIANDDAELYVTVSNTGGVTFYPDVRVSASPSNAVAAAGKYDFGDYEALAFQSGFFFPAWADNSNSTGDNLDGALSKLDIYVNRVQDTTGGAALGLVPSRLPDGVINFQYGETISATGGTGPYAFSHSGTLPAGITLNCSSVSCALSGIPTSSGTFNFTVSVTDSASHAGNWNYSWNIAAGCVFCDDFGDGVLSLQWSYLKPAWSEGGGSLNANPSGKTATAVAIPAFSGCGFCTVEAAIQTSGGLGSKVWLFGWYQDKHNTVELLLKEAANTWILRQRINGVIAVKKKAAFPIDPNTVYDVRLGFDGANFTLTVDGTPLILLPAAGPAFGTVGFQVKESTASFDFILVS